MSASPFARDITADGESLVQCVARKATPSRVHYLELFLDPEIKQAICDRSSRGCYATIRSADSSYQKARILSSGLRQNLQESTNVGNMARM